MWFFCTTGHAMSGPAPLFDFVSPVQNIFREEVFHLEAFWSAPPSEPPSAPRRTTWVGWTSWTRTCRGSPPPQSGSPRQISQSQFGRARPCLGIWPHDIYCQVLNCHCLKSQVSGLFLLFLSLPSIAKYIVRQNDAIYATQRLKNCEELRITFSEAWPRVAWGRGCRRGGCTWSQEISSGSFLFKKFYPMPFTRSDACFIPGKECTNICCTKASIFSIDKLTRESFLLIGTMAWIHLSV